MAAPGPGGASLLGGARTWPLKRYGRFRPPAEGGDEGPNASSWKVFESNEESGHLILTIVVSGHFFISQGRTVLAAVNHDQLLKCRDITETPKRFTETLLLERAGLMLMTEKAWLGSGNKKIKVRVHLFCDGVYVLQKPKQTLIAASKLCVALIKLWCLKLMRQMFEMVFTAAPCEEEGPCAEGFSLIDSHKWLKVVRRGDCLLLCAQAKANVQNYVNKVRKPATLYQGYISTLVDSSKESVQQEPSEQRKANILNILVFGGDSKEEMLEHCCSCIQKLTEYVPVQVPDEQSQQVSQLGNSENQVRDPEKSASGLDTPDEPLPDSRTSLGERRSVTQLAQIVSFKDILLQSGLWHDPGKEHYYNVNTTVLNRKSELPLVYRHAVWRPQELGPFIRLCLMDQSFPAFVEDVEKELKKLAEG